MQRRHVLKRTGAAVSVGLFGGCLSRGDSSGDNPGDGSGDESTTTTTQPTSTLENRSLEFLDAGCGNETNAASVSFKAANRTVVVTGTITGSDSCARPVIRGASMTPDTGNLTVTIGTKKKDGAAACAECLTELEYRATFTFGASIPDQVEVVHQSLGETKTVATVQKNDTSTTTTAD